MDSVPMEPGKPPDARISALFCAASRYVRLPSAPSSAPMMGANVFACWNVELMFASLFFAGLSIFSSCSICMEGSALSSSAQRCMVGAQLWMEPSSVEIAAMFSEPSWPMHSEGGVCTRLCVSGTMALSEASVSTSAMAWALFTSSPMTGIMPATFHRGDERASSSVFADACNLVALWAAPAKS